MIRWNLKDGQGQIENPCCLLPMAFSLLPAFWALGCPETSGTKTVKDVCLEKALVPGDILSLISWYPQDVLKMRNAWDYYLLNVTYKYAQVPIMDVCVANLLNQV